MTRQAATPQEPPAPPETRPRLHLRTSQLVGMLFFAAFPLAALLGLFGDSTAEVGAPSAALELRVSYPTRFRYKTIHPLEVRVRNRSANPLDRVVVTFDQEYVSGFSNVRFTPEAVRAYEVELRGVQPGEERLVSVEVQAERYGRHRGTVTAASGAEAVTAELQTFTFP